MIPISLTLRGFLSYKEPVTVDFSRIEVACISGANGSGKSSLLDGITWVLFGKSRAKDDDTLINDSSETCRAEFEFDYENDRYRVQREKPRGKSALLELQIRSADGGWKPLTEAGMRLTQDKINDVLRLDYDTFINASFFLQGKADMFTQQKPADRKEILSTILGLEVWEKYKDAAAERRKTAAVDVKSLHSRLDEVLAELAEEDARTERLRLLMLSLEKASALNAELEGRWSSAQREVQEFQHETEKAMLLNKQIDSARKRLSDAEADISERSKEKAAHEELVDQAGAIEKAYHVWQGLRSDLERWNSLAADSHRLQSEKAILDARIQAETARLEQELLHLRASEKDITADEAALPGLLAQRQDLNARLAESETWLRGLEKLEEERTTATNKRADLRADFDQKKSKKDEVQDRLARLASATGSSCPLCGQPLNEAHRKDMRTELESELVQLDGQLEAITTQGLVNKDGLAALDQRIAELKALQETVKADQNALGALNAHIDQTQSELDLWKKKDHPRLNDLEKILAGGSYCADEREKVSQLQAAIRSTGYDDAAHEEARRAELAARDSEAEFRDLEKARAALDGLTRGLQTLEGIRAAADEDVRSYTAEFTDLQKKLSIKKEMQPDMVALQDEIDKAKTEENRLRIEVGGAKQEVAVLETQRKRKAELGGQIEDLNRQITRLKLLETAFGKDGIPAMLIEQALPEIESQANEMLDRLSDGRMSLSFETEKEYKDKKRDDKKPTLDILISDASGRREYELFSGGEAFRINFAIRLALSRVLAGRAGAKLRTLVIDEGFGSQDADGIQRLIEAIRLVSRDFDKILVITHLDELKNAFDSRIEVAKTEFGSRAEVIP